MRKFQCDSCPNRRPGMICDVPADSIEEFQLTGATAVYKPRQVIFSEGSPSTGLYQICYGSVKLYHSDRFGRDYILEIVGPGAILGEMSADSNVRLSTSAEAITDTQLCFLPRERLMRFVQHHPETGLRLLSALSVELATAREKIRDLALKDAESRLAGLLMALARNGNADIDTGQHIQLRYTRREMAEMIGVSTETAIRLLARLKQKRAIATERRELVIIDADKLKRIAEHTSAIAA